MKQLLKIKLPTKFIFAQWTKFPWINHAGWLWLDEQTYIAETYTPPNSTRIEVTSEKKKMYHTLVKLNNL